MTKDKQSNLQFMILASVVILLSIFLLFFMGDSDTKNKITNPFEANYPPMSESNDVETIEEDLNATDLSDIDQELEAIESELEAAY